MYIRIPMTFQAPAHVERLAELDHFHFRDIAVTRNTTHPGIDMGRVIEVSIVRKVVHANPLDRLAGHKTRPHQRQAVTVRVDHVVAVHTGSRRWNIGMSLTLNTGMTVAAIDSEITSVYPMTVRHRLHRTIAHVRILG